MALTDATAPNKIGGYGFIELTNQFGDGPPEKTTNTSKAIFRPGVDGVAVRRDGLQPIPFEILTGRDVESFAAARTLLANYDASANSGPMTITYGGVSWGRYSVLSVRLYSLKAVSGGSGGFHGSSAGAYMRVHWTLVEIDDVG